MKPDVTFILARVLGPVLIIAGVLLITQTQRVLAAMMGFLANDALLMLIGFVNLAIGLGLIALHQRWSSFSAIVISVLGWAFALRGAAALLAPQLMHRGADFILANPVALPIAGCLTALVGVWLAYAGYIAGTMRVDSGGELGDPRRP
jgi:hypothetical protein